MAQEILVRLIVDDSQLEQTEKEIKSLGGSIEKVEKTSKKAGSNLTDSFDKAGDSANNLQGGLEGAIKQTQFLGKAAKTSGAAMRSALISTGIGAFIVLLGAVAANWEEIGKWINGANDGLRKQNDLIRENLTIIDSRQKFLESERKLLELKGESLNRIIGYEKQSLQNKRTELINLAANLATELHIEKSKKSQLTLGEKLANVGLRLRGLPPIQSEQDEERIKELNKALDETNILLNQNEAALFRLNNPEEGKKKGDTKKRDKLTSVDAGIESGIADPYNEQKQKDALRLQALQEGTEEFATLQDERLGLEVQQLERFAQLTNEQIRIEEEAAKKRFEIEQILTRQKQEQNDVRFDSANRLAGALMSLGEESKAAAVAGIIVDQVAGAAQAIQSNVIANAKAVAAFPLTAGQPWVTINTASTIAGIAAGALAAKKAISEIGGSGSVGSFGVPQGQQASAPSFNVVGTSGINQLGQSLANDETPIRAYVVGGDVTSQQEFDRNVIETSSI